MKKISAILSLAFFAFAFQLHSAPNHDNFEYRDLVECTPRAGLPNFFKKAGAGKDIKVAYLGGSITAQMGWRNHSLALFQKLYPKAKFSEIHAAIGGTGSDFGVCRVGKDVLEGNPDLVFVEFAVNDGGAKPSAIRKNMEGIVRQILAHDKNTDICFVYTITAGDVNSMMNGKMRRSSSVMEELADHYGIPSIDFGKRIIELVKADQIEMKSAQAFDKKLTPAPALKTKAAVGANGKIPFAKDGVHPSFETGQILYNEAIERSLPKIYAAGKTAKPRKAIPAKMWDDSIEKVAIVMVKDLPAAKNFEYAPFSKDPWGQFMKMKAGDEFSFKFKGTRVTACARFGVDGGLMEVSIDGGEPKKIRCFDQHCSWNRRMVVTICDNLPDEVHTVKIKALGEKFPKRPILTDEHKRVFDKDPSRFDENFVYISAFLLLGDFVK